MRTRRVLRCGRFYLCGAVFRPQPAASEGGRRWHPQPCRIGMVACQASNNLRTSGVPSSGWTLRNWRVVALRVQVAVKILPPDLLLGQGAELHTFVQVGREGRADACLAATIPSDGRRWRTVVQQQRSKRLA